MKLVINVQVDGNPHVYIALQMAKDSGYFGTDLTYLATCFFHSCTQTYLKNYSSQLAGMSVGTFKRKGFQAALGEFVATDGNMGSHVYNWVKYVVFVLESWDECFASIQNLHRFINREQVGHVQFEFPSKQVYTDTHKTALTNWVNLVSSNFPRMCKSRNPSPVDLHLMTSSLAEGNFSGDKKHSGLTSKSSGTALVKSTEQRAFVRQLRNLKEDDRNSNAVYSHLYQESGTINHRLADILRLITPKVQDMLQREIYCSQEWTVSRTSLSLFSLTLTMEAAAKFKGEEVPQHPHLITWKPPVVIIKIEEDAKKVLRLRCPCFTCKQLIPCRRILAIKGGVFELSDVHFRYTNDYITGVYTIERSVSDLTDFRGSVFTDQDNERHQFLEFESIPVENETVRSWPWRIILLVLYYYYYYHVNILLLFIITISIIFII